MVTRPKLIKLLEKRIPPYRLLVEHEKDEFKVNILLSIMTTILLIFVIIFLWNILMF